MENIEIKLGKFISDIFGDRCCGDVFDIRESFEPDGKIKIIQVFLKKKTDIKKGWIEPGIFNELVRGIKAIVGEFNKLRIFSAEANQIVYVGGIEENESGEFKEGMAKKYDYKFIIEIKKKTGEQNATNKPG